MNSTSTAYPWPSASFRCQCLAGAPDGEGVAARQRAIPGWRQEALAAAHVLCVGAGGLAAHICPQLARKGIGRLTIVDDDVVEPSNLARQFFYPDDMYQAKAICLARNVAGEGMLGSAVVGHDVAFDECTAPALAQGVDLTVIAVDNDRTRALAAQYFLRTRRPVIFTAVNERADYCWAFTQEPEGRPCLACVYPHLADALGTPRRCIASPAAVDVLCLAGALVLYAVDSLLMEGRRRDWSFVSFSLIGDVPPVVARTAARRDCPLCALPACQGEGGRP